MYATVADMVARFGDLEIIQITDRSHSGQIDHSVAEVALADATAEINTYLGRYAVPFATVPPVLTRLACDIARYRLTGASGVLVTEDIERRYKIDVLNLLKALARGEVSLGIDNSGHSVPSGDNVVQFFNAKNRIFARDNRD